jgi:hypothetical protein
MARPVQLHQEHGLPAAQAQLPLHHRKGELVAQHQGNEMGVGIARFIGRDALPQMEIVMEPGAIGRGQVQKKALNVAQQPFLVFIEGQSGGGVLAHGHQEAITDAAAIDLGLELRGDVVAAEGAGRLQLKAVVEKTSHWLSRDWRGWKSVSIAHGPGGGERSRVG